MRRRRRTVRGSRYAPARLIGFSQALLTRHNACAMPRRRPICLAAILCSHVIRLALYRCGWLRSGADTPGLGYSLRSQRRLRPVQALLYIFPRKRAERPRKRAATGLRVAQRAPTQRNLYVIKPLSGKGPGGQQSILSDNLLVR